MLTCVRVHAYVTTPPHLHVFEEREGERERERESCTVVSRMNIHTCVHMWHVLFHQDMFIKSTPEPAVVVLAVAARSFVFWQELALAWRS